MARGIDGGPVGRDALVRSMPAWRGWNELRGEPQVSWWGRVGRSGMGDRSLALPRRERERARPRRLKRGIRRDVDEKVTHRSRHTI